MWTAQQWVTENDITAHRKILQLFRYSASVSPGILVPLASQALASKFARTDEEARHRAALVENRNATGEEQVGDKIARGGTKWTRFVLAPFFDSGREWNS